MINFLQNIFNGSRIEHLKQRLDQKDILIRDLNKTLMEYRGYLDRKTSLLDAADQKIGDMALELEKLRHG